MPNQLSRRSVLTTGTTVAAGATLTAGVATPARASTGTDAPADPVAATIAMAVRFDRKQWAALRDVFSPTIFVDYSRLTGVEAGTVPSSGLVRDWERNLGQLDATQHLLANHIVRIRDRTASVTADFQATHRLGPLTTGRLWTLGGHYEYTIVRGRQGWRINAVTMHPSWETGDRTIIGLPAR